MPLQSEFKFGASTIKINAKNAKDWFVQMSIFSELPHSCGKCDCDKIGPVHRVVGQDNDEYFNLKCLNPECGAIFDVGQRRDGGLFPKFDPDKRTNVDHGWYHFDEQDFGSRNDRGSDDRGRGGNDRRDNGGGQGQRGGNQGNQRGGYDNQRGNGGQGGNQRGGGNQGQGGGNGGYQDEEDDIPF